MNGSVKLGLNDQVIRFVHFYFVLLLVFLDGPVVVLHFLSQLLQQILGFLEFLPPVGFEFCAFLVLRLLLLLFYLLIVMFPSALPGTDHPLQILSALLRIKCHSRLFFLFPLLLLLIFLAHQHSTY